MKAPMFAKRLLPVLLLCAQAAWASEDYVLKPENFLQPDQYQFFQFYRDLPEMVEVLQKPDTPWDTVKIAKKDLVGSICSHFIKTVEALEKGDYGEVDDDQIQRMTNHSFRLCKNRIPKIQARLQR